MKLLNTCLLHYAIVVGALLGAPLRRSRHSRNRPVRRFELATRTLSGWEPAHDSLVEDSAVIALEKVALAAGSGADGNNLGLGFASNFPYNQKTQSTH